MDKKCGLCLLFDTDDCNLKGKVKKNASYGEHCLEFEMKPEPIFDQDVKPDQITEYLLGKYDFKTMKDTKEIFYYEDGIYRPGGEVLIESETEKLTGKKTKTHFVKEVLGHVQRQTYIDRKEFDKDPGLLTLENGVLGIKSRILNPFKPEYLSLIKLPITYDPEAKCPAIENFLKEIVEPENVELLKEIAGYLLEPSYFIHKSFMLVGGGFNAKSTYIDLLIHFIGQENTSQEPLQDLIYKTFSTAELYGKLMNSFADLTNVALTRTGRFKALCGGDRIKGRTLYHRPFYFYNKAKLIFSTNTLPKSDDVTDAYFGRWIIVPFPYVFDETNPKTDKRILEKLTSSQELSGFLNLALEKLEQLRQNQKFTSDKTTEEIRDLMMKLSDPVYAFIEERCLIDSNSWIPKQDLFNAFIEYCEEKKLLKLSQRTFTEDLKKQIGHKLGELRSMIKGKRTRTWTGIKLIEKEEKKPKIEETLDKY